MPSQRTAVRAWSVGLVLLCAGALWLQVTHINNSLPYPVETDEAPLSRDAVHILQTGELKPPDFIYPTLPDYLAAVGMSVGFLRGAVHLEIYDVRHIGNVGYPYYTTTGAMRGARVTFALLGIAALAATGIAAWQAFSAPSMILLAPLVLWAFPLFFHHSWAYLNVDIASTCFVACTLAACLKGIRQPTIWQAAVIPGVFAGLATGSKYTAAMAILPVLAAIGLYWKGTARFWAALSAVAAMMAAFLVVVPYSVFALPRFLNGVAFEALHYSGGHIGADANPGWPQLVFYGRHFASELGAAGVVLAVLGLVRLAATDWRRTLVLASFPAALLWLLCSQRVHFARNALPMDPIAALLAASGALAVYRGAASLAVRAGGRWATGARAAAVLVILAAAVPFAHVRDHLRNRTDSRNLAERWIEQHVPAGWTIAVAPQLGFDARALEARGQRVVEVDLRSAHDAAAVNRVLGDAPRPTLVLLPHWGADDRFSGQELADTLNSASSGLRVVKAFGSNSVLVNYPPPTAWGDPAFAAAVVGDERLAAVD